jgi:hypothetical protein
MGSGASIARGKRPTLGEKRRPEVKGERNSVEHLTDFTRLTAIYPAMSSMVAVDTRQPLNSEIRRFAPEPPFTFHFSPFTQVFGATH